MLFKLTVKGENPGTHKLLTYQFENSSRALVLAEAVKFIKLVVMVVYSATISETLAGGDLTSLVPAAAGSGADAFITLRHSSGRTSGKRINEMSDNYAVGVLFPGVVDVSNTDITDAFALWKDEFGNTGYTVESGRYLD